MKPFVIIFSSLILFFSCNKNTKNKTINKSTPIKPTVNGNLGYHLSLSEKPSKLLILFPGFPSNSQVIQNEFPIDSLAKANNISVLYMNYNRKLQLELEDKKELASTLLDIIKTHNLSKDSVFIGGMSSGGNMSLLISDYLVEHNLLNPKGVFIVDSPIDLYQLYLNSLIALKTENNNGFISEAQWLLDHYTNLLNENIDNAEAYDEISPVSTNNHDFRNIENLQNTKVRFYTEPDTTWWLNTYLVQPTEMNAYFIKNAYQMLKVKGWENIELIETEDKGYRSNGAKNPHSWSIVDFNDLIHWMNGKTESSEENYTELIDDLIKKKMLVKKSYQMKSA